MISTRPYLIRAIHEWCADQGFTPYLAVQVDENTQVPRKLVRDGQIVLNVSFDATNQLVLGNDEITFQTRFGGAMFQIAIPVDAVIAIYARENGQGMTFESPPRENNADADKTATVPATPDAKPPTRRGSHLTRVK